MASKNKLAVIVATRNRPELISDLFDSISSLTIRPEQVVVVDSSDDSLKLSTTQLSALEKSIAPTVVNYFTTTVKSLPSQRNIGLDLIYLDDFEFILFLDDDTRPEPNYAERLIETLDFNPGALGCSGVTAPPPPRIYGFKKWVRILFFLYSDKGGVVLRSGINLPIRDHQHGPVQTEWIFGCSLWKSGIFSKIRYPENLPAGALYEDVIFSVRSSAYGSLWVNPDAYLMHMLANIGRPDPTLDGIRKVRNRYEVIKCLRRPATLSHAAFWWSTFGKALLLIRHALPWYFGNGRIENQVVAHQLKGHFLGALRVLFKRSAI